VKSQQPVNLFTQHITPCRSSAFVHFILWNNEIAFQMKADPRKQNT